MEVIIQIAVLFFGALAVSNLLLDIFLQITRNTKHPAVSADLYITIDGVRKKVDGMQTMKVTQQAEIEIVDVKDKFGNLTKLDGIPMWSLNDESYGSVKQSSDGLSAAFMPSGKIGVVELQALSDADLGDGVKPIVFKAQVQLLPGDAVTASLSIKVKDEEGGVY